MTAPDEHTDTSTPASCERPLHDRGEHGATDHQATEHEATEHQATEHQAGSSTERHDAHRRAQPTLRRTSDGSPTLHHPTYAQTYHSTHGAWTESLHVFVHGTGVLDHARRAGSVRVLEVGFGTGMNFLATVATLPADARLDFVSFERDPLPADTLRTLRLTDLPGVDASLVTALIRMSEDGASTLSWGDSDRVRLRIIPGDASQHVLEAGWLERLAGEAARTTSGSRPSSGQTGGFDAIYHDAFSPEANPELWSESFLEALVSALRPGGVLGTYTVQGAVRRTLAGLGLDVRRTDGPAGGKRQVLRAQRSGPPED